MSLNVERVPPHIGYYLAGFVDGEGSFNVVFRKRKDYMMPWKISACFNVSQRDENILGLLKKHLKCGSMRRRRDGVWYFEVNSQKDIVANVIPFFKRFQFLSDKKQRDFSKFESVVRLIQDGMHLRRSGIEMILNIRKDMNDGGVKRRKYSEAEILDVLSQMENPQRLHAEKG